MVYNNFNTFINVEMNDILIKGASDNTYRNGYDYYHVRMGSGFIDTIEGFAELKESIENNVRTENGVRMIINTKVAKRTFVLTFNIHGSTKAAYLTNKSAFETMLRSGLVSIKINDSNRPNYYHLAYTGKSVSYKHSYNGRFGTIACQFVEPNPANRTSTQNTYVRVV